MNEYQIQQMKDKQDDARHYRLLNERLVIDIERMRAGVVEADKFEQELMAENERLRGDLKHANRIIAQLTNELAGGVSDST